MEEELTELEILKNRVQAILDTSTEVQLIHIIEDYRNRQPGIKLPKKKCPNCNELKELDQFSMDNSRLDGLQIYCKSCNNKKK